MARGHYDSRSFRSGSIGGKPVFNCTICGRSTRMTTQNDDRFCAQCDELLMMQNGLWDDGVEAFKAWNGMKARDEFASKLVKHGGDYRKVVAAMPDLFAVEPVK